MKRIILLFSIMLMVLMATANSFAEVDRVYKPYEIPVWENEKNFEDKCISIMDQAFKKGLLSENKIKKLKEISYSYWDLVYYNQELKKTDTSDENKKIYSTEGVFLDRQGVTRYICYNNAHIKAAIDLSIYGLLEDDDPLFEMNTLATRGDFLRAYITLLGHKQEALSETIKHPFQNVPEEIDSYVSFAYNKGWLDDYKNESVWDDNNIDLTFCGKIAERALGGIIDKKELEKKSYYYDIWIFPRLGAFEDVWNNRMVLSASEPMRRGDIVSMMSLGMKRLYKNQWTRVEDILMDEKIISHEAFDYVNGCDFFLKSKRDKQITDIAMKAYYYGCEYGNVKTLLHWDAPLMFDQVKYDKTVCLINFEASRNISEERMKSQAIQVLADFGVSVRDADKALTYVLKNKIRSADSPVLTSIYGGKFTLFFNHGFKTLWMYVDHPEYDKYLER